jgi:hypothetical protein
MTLGRSQQKNLNQVDIVDEITDINISVSNQSLKEVSYDLFQEILKETWSVVNAVESVKNQVSGLIERTED